VSSKEKIYLRDQWRQIQAAAADAATAYCADRHDFQAGSAFLVRQALARIEAALAASRA
jgi:hypothetical protein